MSRHYTCDCFIEKAFESDSIILDSSLVDRDSDFITRITSHDYGEQDVSGIAGIEDHLIEIGGLGHVSFRAVFHALPRHDRCTCDPGSADEYPFASLSSRPATPGLSLAGSMVVEVSEVQSLQSRSSSMFALAGACITHESLASSAGVYISNTLRMIRGLASPLEAPSKGARP